MSSFFQIYSVIWSNIFKLLESYGFNFFKFVSLVQST